MQLSRSIEHKNISLMASKDWVMDQNQSYIKTSDVLSLFLQICWENDLKRSVLIGLDY